MDDDQVGGLGRGTKTSVWVYLSQKRGGGSNVSKGSGAGTVVPGRLSAERAAKATSSVPTRRAVNVQLGTVGKRGRGRRAVAHAYEQELEPGGGMTWRLLETRGRTGLQKAAAVVPRGRGDGVRLHKNSD